MACGCDADGPPLVRVQGVVTLDGQPLAGKAVRFIPDRDTPGAGAGANTNADGAYDLIAVRPGAVRDVMGIPPGVYTVTITEPIFPVEFDIPVHDDSEVAPAIGLPPPRTVAKATIPPRYTDPATSPLRIEVTEEGGVYNLELTSKP